MHVTTISENSASLETQVGADRTRVGNVFILWLRLRCNSVPTYRISIGKVQRTFRMRVPWLHHQSWLWGCHYLILFDAHHLVHHSLSLVFSPAGRYRNWSYVWKHVSNVWLAIFIQDLTPSPYCVRWKGSFVKCSCFCPSERNGTPGDRFSDVSIQTMPDIKTKTTTDRLFSYSYFKQKRFKIWWLLGSPSITQSPPIYRSNLFPSTIAKYEYSSHPTKTIVESRQQQKQTKCPAS